MLLHITGKSSKKVVFYKIQGRGKQYAKGGIYHQRWKNKVFILGLKENSVMVPMVLRKVWSSQGRKVSSSGYSFVLVAGMEYANHVSSKGFNVLIQEF